MKSKFIGIAVIVAGFILTTQLAALTISPALRAKLEANGVWDQFNRKFSRWQEQLADQQPAFDTKHAFAKSAIGNGQVTVRVCVLLVDFSDKTAASGFQSTVTPAVVDNILFSQGTTQYGSMTDFYLESSYGQFLVDGDVFGWFRLPKTYAQYVGSDNGLQAGEPNARTMARDAIAVADPTVNFAPYDNNSDGFVDAVFVIHAGTGAEETGSASEIWSHRWNTGGQVLTGDGKKVFSYLTAPEEVLGGPLRVGVYAHEFGHILGLPDLYDVGPKPSKPGLGNWSLMAGGSWNNNQRTPAQFDGWCKHVLDSLYGAFGKTIDVTGNLTDVVLGAAVEDSIRYRLSIPGVNRREYFIVENRQLVGFDTYLPGAGLMVLHCDDNLSGSNNQSTSGHWRISLEQADGAFDLENAVNDGDADDLFPGVSGDYLEWTNLTTPNTDSWYGNPNQLAIWYIRSDTQNKTITCNLDATYSRANLALQSCNFSDLASGNGNLIFEKGETVQVAYGFKNLWKTASGVKVVLTSTTPGITILNGVQEVGSVNSGETMYSTIPLSFAVGADVTPTNAHLELDLISADPPDTFRTSYLKFVGGIEILLVDDDGSPTLADQSTFLKQALDSLSRPYAYWDVATLGAPGLEQYSYTYVFWFTGNQSAGTDQPISPAEIGFLRGYLNQGGKLFLAGQDIAEGLSAGSDSTFLRDYLGVRYLSDCRPLDAIGIAGNPLSGNLNLRIHGQDGANNQSDCDILQILPGASHAFNLLGAAGALFGAGGCSAARPNGSRVVFLSFGLEAVTTNHAALGYDTRFDLARQALSYLAGNVSTDVDDDAAQSPLPLSFQLNQNYPNPFNPTTQISFTVLPSANGAPLTLDVFNVLGQRIVRLRSEIAQAGTQSFEFNAANLSSGVYLYRLSIGNDTQTKKMVLSK
jgi:immune inhibitor A